jgi:uncharacterized membrane protein
MKRVLRHLFSDQLSARRAFPAAVMAAIKGAVARGEKRHDGELRFAVEASLPLSYVLSGKSARDRAVDTFAQLRVWDTEHNSGVLIYVLLADRRVEIVADRGINAKVEDGAWNSICAQMQQAFGAGRFEAGAVAGVVAISDLLAQHFPAQSSNPNELPDEPVVL